MPYSTLNLRPTEKNSSRKTDNEVIGSGIIPATSSSCNPADSSSKQSAWPDQDHRAFSSLRVHPSELPTGLASLEADKAPVTVLRFIRTRAILKSSSSGGEGLFLI